MNEEKNAIKHHREEMAFWLSVQKDAKWRKDEETEKHAIIQYRYHRDTILALWSMPEGRSMVCA